MPSAPYLIKALLLSLIDHIETDTPAGRGSKSKQTFLELTTYLRENFAQEITRTEIAKVFHLHPNHISRIFKKEGNISFANYLSQLRIEFAKQMLAQEKALTIEEIAYRCGFSSSSYFGKSFRRYTGTSPLQFLNCLNHS
jgi:YesN/AraC family two-component response regulator